MRTTKQDGRAHGHRPRWGDSRPPGAAQQAAAQGRAPRSLLGQDVESPGSRSREHPAQQSTVPSMVARDSASPRVRPAHPLQGPHVAHPHEGRQEAETRPRSQGRGRRRRARQGRADSVEPEPWLSPQRGTIRLAARRWWRPAPAASCLCASVMHSRRLTPRQQRLAPRGGQARKQGPCRGDPAPPGPGAARRPPLLLPRPQGHRGLDTGSRTVPGRAPTSCCGSTDAGPE